MKKSKAKIFLSLVLAAVLAFSCLSVFSFAGSLTIVSQPTQKSCYQGIDWMYTKDNELTLLHNPDLSGTVLSDGKKTVSYKFSKFANMNCKPVSGKWVEGSNAVEIECDDLTGYATTTINLVKVKSAKVITPPANTVFVKGIDWKPGVYGDVEFASCDLTGLKLSVTYTDGATKTVSYPENQLIGWSVPKDTTYILPGDTTLYATFCGAWAPFDVTFATSDPYKLGDATKDGQINSHDALVILQHSTGMITLDATAARLADVTKDSQINSYDALMVLRYSVGLIKNF